MPVSSYGASTDSLAAPSLSSWAASVSAALDGSDTTVSTRITQRVLPLTAKTGNYTLTASDTVVTCNGTLTITLPTAVGLTGKQFIIRNIATNTVTIARTSSQTVDGCSGTITLAGKGSLAVVSDGANWLVVSGQYTDESVGRRIFTWSSALANGATTGWQMTYGDTGWRDVSGSFINSWLGLWQVRRMNGVLYHSIYNVRSGTGNVWVAPVGFRGGVNTVDTQAVPVARYDVASHSAIGCNNGAAGGYTVLGGAVGYAGAVINAVITTYEAWPSSLPGTAVGSIPAL